MSTGEFRLYRVTLRALLRESEEILVLSRLGECKAVSITVDAHFQDAEDFWDRTMWPIHAVDVDDPGPPPRPGEGPPLPNDWREDRAGF